jgi:hypothetical protein
MVAGKDGQEVERFPTDPPSPIGKLAKVLRAKPKEFMKGEE